VTMSIWGIASKAAMFLIGYAVMRTVGVARSRRQRLRDVTGDRPVTDDLVKAGLVQAGSAS
jgi:hypothetical protein